MPEHSALLQLNHWQVCWEFLWQRHCTRNPGYLNHDEAHRTDKKKCTVCWVKKDISKLWAKISDIPWSMEIVWRIRKENHWNKSSPLDPLLCRYINTNCWSDSDHKLRHSPTKCSSWKSSFDTTHVKASGTCIFLLVALQMDEKPWRQMMLCLKGYLWPHR
jgi:hypothetical protein